jgi:ketosteroid isomerase-like protein
MSEDNVEVVRAASQAWNAGDMDAFRELHDPGVLLHGITTRPTDAGTVGYSKKGQCEVRRS